MILHEEFKNEDLVFLKVSTKEKERDIKKYKKDFNITSSILLDEDASAATSYGVWNRPNTFFINREGKIVGRVLKEIDWATGPMKNLIQFLLKEKK